ncbi:DUF4230 domain-containing protein [Campylobacter sputorum]|uniref:DUF4230 domain-containing protein n=1 Tax=Campylobacter sputorum TaxID=206 RepID=UPI000B775AEE|nr:DUF4230 domain-containing protein [Campylobacter sputorum]ASM37090.1 DUF4230 domain protein [Campylobacter sputorum bv. faecalis CCUG 20703]
MEILTLIITFLLVLTLTFVYRQAKEIKTLSNVSKPDITSEITNFRSIGELNVFQIISKEIVTKKADAMNGKLWKPLFGWSLSQKQIAIIFGFEINFIYDLRSDEFNIENLQNGEYKITMPPCKYKYSITDMKIYDEKNSKFLPFLLPDSINGLLGVSFSEEDKNKLIDEAKNEVKSISLSMIKDLETKIHKSATDTLNAIANSFGAKNIEYVFQDNKAQSSKVSLDIQDTKEEKI